MFSEQHHGHFCMPFSIFMHNVPKQGSIIVTLTCNDEKYFAQKPWCADLYIEGEKREELLQMFPQQKEKYTE